MAGAPFATRDWPAGPSSTLSGYQGTRKRLGLSAGDRRRRTIERRASNWRSFLASPGAFDRGRRRNRRRSRSIESSRRRGRSTSETLIRSLIQSPLSTPGRDPAIPVSTLVLTRLAGSSWGSPTGSPAASAPHSPGHDNALRKRRRSPDRPLATGSGVRALDHLTAGRSSHRAFPALRARDAACSGAESGPGISRQAARDDGAQPVAGRAGPVPACSPRGDADTSHHDNAIISRAEEALQGRPPAANATPCAAVVDAEPAVQGRSRLPVPLDGGKRCVLQYVPLTRRTPAHLR